MLISKIITNNIFNNINKIIRFFMKLLYARIYKHNSNGADKGKLKQSFYRGLTTVRRKQVAAGFGDLISNRVRNIEIPRKDDPVAHSKFFF